MDQAFTEIQTICDSPNSRSQVFRSGSHGHLNSIRHHYESSAQDASFSVEPGSAEDLSKIMTVIKKYRVSFAVKSGGHTSNPTFSSTTGIQISLSRFTKIVHDQANNQLTVGAGCVFDEIYKFIRPKGYNIVGGGGSVGLSGWIMGGGYSLKTNQYGLGIDNLVQVQIVLPDGKVVMATENINNDLFWAIKGGGNNFGIATEFVLKTHPQGTGETRGNVYGGLLTFDKCHVERVKRAIVDFMEKKDPKAAIVTAFRFYRNHGIQEFKFTVLAFYDDEKPEHDPFEDFLAIPHQGQLANSPYTELDTATTLLYGYIPADVATMILSPSEKDRFARASFPSPEIAGIGVMNARARWGNVMVSKYTQNLINVVEEEAKAAKRLMEKHKGRMVVGEIWPFLPTMFDTSVDSAWPHREGAPNGPLLVYFMWEGRENDKPWVNQMKAALHHIHQIALREECTTPDAPVYCNTTLEEVTTPQQIYRHNLSALSALRTKYDPDDVMGKTGGFRIPLGPAIINGTYKITNANNNDAIGVSRPSGHVVKVDDTDDCPVGSRITSDTEEWVVCGPQEDTWKVIPESRGNNQLEYSIVNLAGDKRWVLDGK
ncbi:hypothetical protein DFH94DRAFT_318194 [Russula ochroleuca]|uniref:FAD-binding PCMH-type domain-containing protein n=1 Tax=Russula ochroleuca TaxID=152965 RepID=A0A9P5N0Y0_9AGAM|nr:hypothetical protein DFH94DRAFT_318194 [Russula ochroleuca]